MPNLLLKKIVDGRTDLVVDFVNQGESACSTDEYNTQLIEWCAYYGYVTAVKFLLSKGVTLSALGDNFDLNGDSPLTWASRHLRPASILKLLCFDDFSIHPDNQSSYDHGVGWGTLDFPFGKPHN